MAPLPVTEPAPPLKLIWLALSRKLLDPSASVEPMVMVEVTGDPELSPALVRFPQAATQFLAMNLTQPPFNDKKVREAFAYAIDRKTFCEQVRAGDCQALRVAHGACDIGRDGLGAAGGGQGQQQHGRWQ